jgi:hypothetical protein
MQRWWMFGVVALTSCNPYRKVMLQGDFVEICPGGNPTEAWLRFEPHHRFDWAYQQGGPYMPGDDETWRLRRDELEVSWNDGFAVSTYDLQQRKGTIAPGESTKQVCAASIHLDWLRKRPNAQ